MATTSSTTARPLGVVTGGSSGIGFQLAKQFIEHGYDVLIAADLDVEEARSKLASSDGANVYAVQADLTDDVGIGQLCDEITALGRPVEALALNAGIGVGGSFLDTDLDEEVKMIELNCTSVVKLAKRIVPAMVARHQGHVLVTSSIAATMPSPYLAVYGATKAFDLSFAEGLRDELRDTGVTVTAVQPGPTDTSFFERAHLENTKVGEADKDDPALVAEQAFDAMIHGKDKVYAGSLETRVQGLVTEVLPETVKARMHRAQAQPRSQATSDTGDRSDIGEPDEPAMKDVGREEPDVEEIEEEERSK